TAPCLPPVDRAPVPDIVPPGCHRHSSHDHQGPLSTARQPPPPPAHPMPQLTPVMSKSPPPKSPVRAWVRPGSSIAAVPRNATALSYARRPLIGVRTAASRRSPASVRPVARPRFRSLACHPPRSEEHTSELQSRENLV